MNGIRFVVFLLAVWAHGSAVVAQGHGSLPQPSNETIAAFVDSYISRAVAERRIPGAAVVLVKDGRTFFERGYGVGDYESRRPISPEDSVLRQGSTAKLFVWVLVMQLVEERRLDLTATSTGISTSGSQTLSVRRSPCGT